MNKEDTVKIIEFYESIGYTVCEVSQNPDGTSLVVRAERTEDVNFAKHRHDEMKIRALDGKDDSRNMI